jgi:hypothetical protein
MAKKTAPKRTSKPLSKKASAARKKTPIVPYLESWDTRYGKSERVVLRQGGKFVDNTSLSSLKRGARVTSR